MAGEAIVKASEGGKKMAGERALRNYLDEFDRKYWVSVQPQLELERTLAGPPAGEGRPRSGHACEGLATVAGLWCGACVLLKGNVFSLLFACCALMQPPPGLALPPLQATYKVLDILQKVFYRSNPAREAFVELCEDTYVQKMTFDSYLYKVSGGGRERGTDGRLEERQGTAVRKRRPLLGGSAPSQHPCALREAGMED